MGCCGRRGPAVLWTLRPRAVVYDDDGSFVDEDGVYEPGGNVLNAVWEEGGHEHAYIQVLLAEEDRMARVARLVQHP